MYNKKILKINNQKWIELINEFLKKNFKHNFSLNFRPDDEKGIYITSLYDDISYILIQLFKKELDVGYYSYNTRFGINAIHIRNLPEKFVINDELETKCIHKFMKLFIKERNTIEKNYLEKFKKDYRHNLYKKYLIFKKFQVNKNCIQNVEKYINGNNIEKYSKINIKYKEMEMYNKKYNVLLHYLNKENNYFRKTYIKRDKILSLEEYFINFWNK